MLLAATVLGETLQASVVLGAAVVLGSVMAMQLDGRWRRRVRARVAVPAVAVQHVLRRPLARRRISRIWMTTFHSKFDKVFCVKVFG